MRREMDFESLAKSRIADTAKEGNKSADGESLTLESIRYGLRFQSRIAEAWLKIIQVTTVPADHCPLDIFVLLMLHDIAGFKVGLILPYCTNPTYVHVLRSKSKLFSPARLSLRCSKPR